MQSRQKLGIILENEMSENVDLSKNVNRKSFSPKLILLNKNRKYV